MEPWQTVVGLTLFAGMAMPVGAWIASFRGVGRNWLQEELRHAVMAFGGGALMSAVALVLVPEGIKQLSVFTAVVCFSIGGLAFMGLDILLDRWNSPAGQLVAMLSDFIPEAIALGASFALGGEAGLLLAGLMALQNLPEGFNACRELKAASSLTANQIVIAFALMALLGPVAGLAGLFWLSHYPAVVSGIMLFAGAGILYLIFDDIAPQSKQENRRAPALGAVMGFMLGMVGQMLVNS